MARIDGGEVLVLVVADPLHAFNVPLLIHRGSTTVGGLLKLLCHGASKPVDFAKILIELHPELDRIRHHLRDGNRNKLGFGVWVIQDLLRLVSGHPVLVHKG